MNDIIWLEFFSSSFLIIIAGIQLTSLVDRLSDQLNLGKLWLGMVLLGLVTSLPEAVTSFSAIKMYEANDLALGNIMGSNNFNPLLIVILDLCMRGKSITQQLTLNKSHLVSIGIVIFLTLLLMLDIFLISQGTVMSLGWLSFSQWILFAAYFVTMAILYFTDKKNHDVIVDPLPQTSKQSSPAVLILKIFLTSVVVVTAAIWLARTSDVIAETTGLGETFIGTLLVAFVTSLPEVVVTVSALRLGNIDFVIGNILGSNLTNLFILANCDWIDGAKIFFTSVSMHHMIMASASILMILILLMGMKVKNKKLFLNLGFDAWLMLITFLGSSFLLFQLTN